jgi:predicted lipoprotein with Yx(FWY)xxD motif
MRKSGWAVAAAGLGSLVLLLTACGGSSSSSASSAATGSSGSTSTPKAGAQPSGGTNVPSAGTTVLIVEHSNLGWVLAEANGMVVYTYGGDTKGGSPTCTGACEALWPAVTGSPAASPDVTLPGTLGTVSMSNGAKQITYNGYPLYTLKGAGALSTRGQGIEGKWHVIKMSKTDITTGA